MSCAPRLPTPSRHLPGDLAMWLFILAELSVFALFFALYAVTRYRQPALFAAGQAQLPLLSALVNTLLLISGSACVARAVEAVGRARSATGARWLRRSNWGYWKFSPLIGW